MTNESILVDEVKELTLHDKTFGSHGFFAYSTYERSTLLIMLLCLINGFVNGLFWNLHLETDLVWLAYVAFACACVSVIAFWYNFFQLLNLFKYRALIRDGASRQVVGIREEVDAMQAVVDKKKKEEDKKRKKREAKEMKKMSKQQKAEFLAAREKREEEEAEELIDVDFWKEIPVFAASRVAAVPVK